MRKPLALGLTGLVVACASAPVAPPCTALYEASYIDFWRDVRARNAVSVAALATQFAARTDPASRLRHAMAIAAPQHPQRDEALAQQIADEVAVARDATDATREAAAWFALWLGESRRNDGATRRAQSDAKRAEQLEARLRETEKRAIDAERKLDALKQIDREMTERPSGHTARP